MIVYGFDGVMVQELRKTGANFVIDARAHSGRRLLADLERLGAVSV